MSINLQGDSEEEVTLSVFSQEIYFQVIAALDAKARLFQTEINLDENGMPIFENGLYSGDDFRIRAENFLLRCAAVARIFNHKKRARRCEILRRQLLVELDHPLFNTGVRNAMQHYDEYLDDLVKSIRSQDPNVYNFRHNYETNADGSFSIAWHDRQLTSHEFSEIIQELERLKSLLESFNSYLRRPGNP